MSRFSYAPFKREVIGYLPSLNPKTPWIRYECTRTSDGTLWCSCRACKYQTTDEREARKAARKARCKHLEALACGEVHLLPLE